MLRMETEVRAEQSQARHRISRRAQRSGDESGGVPFGIPAVSQMRLQDVRGVHAELAADSQRGAQSGTSVGRAGAGLGILRAFADRRVWIRVGRILRLAVDGLFVALDLIGSVLFDSRRGAVGARTGFGAIGS